MIFFASKNDFGTVESTMASTREVAYFLYTVTGGTNPRSLKSWDSPRFEAVGGLALGERMEADV